MKKILSIIVPSYNMEQYLDKCLSSMIVDDEELLQSLDVIVVNDGSKDGTSEIAHAYEAKHPDVFRVIDKNNGHFGSCINSALLYAKGEYIRIQDADDSFRVENFKDFLWFVKRDAEGSLPDVIFNDVSGCTLDGVITDARPHSFPVGKMFSLDDIKGEFFGEGHFSIRRQIVQGLNYHQTEGCPYTDLEWYTWPFICVKTATYFPRPVTCVLNGRDGQSMNAKTYARDFGIVANLVLGLTKRFTEKGKMGSAEGYRFVQSRIYDMIRDVYSTVLLGYSGIMPNCDLRAFDAALKDIDVILYNKVQKPYKLHRCPFVIDLVGGWRKRGDRNSIGFILLRFYFHVVRFAGRVIRRMH